MSTFRVIQCFHFYFHQHILDLKAESLIDGADGLRLAELQLGSPSLAAGVPKSFVEYLMSDFRRDTLKCWSRTFCGGTLRVLVDGQGGGGHIWQ